MPPADGDQFMGEGVAAAGSAEALDVVVFRPLAVYSDLSLALRVQADAEDDRRRGVELEFQDARLTPAWRFGVVDGRIPLIRLELRVGLVRGADAHHAAGLVQKTKLTA